MNSDNEFDHNIHGHMGRRDDDDTGIPDFALDDHGGNNYDTCRTDGNY